VHIQHNKQNTYNVTLRHVHVTIFAVEKENVLYIAYVCVCVFVCVHVCITYYTYTFSSLIIANLHTYSAVVMDSYKIIFLSDNYWFPLPVGLFITLL